MCTWNDPSLIIFHDVFFPDEPWHKSVFEKSLFSGVQIRVCEGQLNSFIDSAFLYAPRFVHRGIVMLELLERLESVYTGGIEAARHLRMFTYTDNQLQSLILDFSNSKIESTLVFYFIYCANSCMLLPGYRVWEPCIHWTWGSRWHHIPNAHENKPLPFAHRIFPPLCY